MIIDDLIFEPPGPGEVAVRPIEAVAEWLQTQGLDVQRGAKAGTWDWGDGDSTPQEMVRVANDMRARGDPPLAPFKVLTPGLPESPDLESGSGASSAAAAVEMSMPSPAYGDIVGG